MDIKEIYKLLDKLHRVETLLREHIRPKLGLDWKQSPNAPLAIAEYCNRAASLLVEIGNTSLKEVDTHACANEKPIDVVGNPSPNKNKRRKRNPDS